MKKTILFFALSLIILQSYSRGAVLPADTLRKNAINVYMESSDFIRKEIPYVNYVREIKDADVYIISTRQNTGSHGTEYTYFLVGQKSFAGMADTLIFTSTPDETAEITRHKQVNNLKMGLMRYVARTPLAGYINITFTEPLQETISTDKWNSWVFRSSISGFLNGEKTFRSTNLSGSLTASRITEDWKINLLSELNQNDTKYLINDSVTIRGTNSSKKLDALVVKSISDHWSAGARTELRSSSFNNEKIRISFMPGIEYDIYPYSESTRRQLRILYTAGYTFVNYMDTTIYNRISENLWSHALSASYEVVQKWGNINLVAEYRNYFHDWSKNNLSLTAFLDLRIARGLTVSFMGSGSMVHDQLGLIRENLPLDQILLQKKKLATQFEYFTSFGFTYTFGSIYNNVVNPRFGNSGGEMMMPFMMP
ncbi:MAG: hypothetical protein GX158_09290 [Bacteroidales bacterium]|jgi:hypothetical protein|nr:hypothetical protein [Bacteroidales bacterium]